MKRSLTILLIALEWLILLPVQAETRFEKSARKKQEIATKIVWTNQEPLMFYRRRGRYPENWPELYERQHAPGNIQLIADAGVRWARLRFYKGFGLQTEMPEMRRSIEVAELMHRLGMKVSLYVAGTMFIESFYREVPGAEGWEQRDQVNRAVPYSDTQTYRHFACPNEPAYREYLKKVLDVGIQQFKADEFFFDNIFLQPEPTSCRCQRCQRAFKEFLRRKYPTKESVATRFGYPDVDWIKVNEWYHYNRPEDIETIDDPVLQEWVAFRSESLARHCIDIYDYIKSVNPKIAVGFNLKGIYGTNRIWRNGMYQPLYQGKIDFACFDVGGMEARLDSTTGALVGEIRSFKMGRTLGFTYHEADTPLQLAVSMAFNYRKPVPGYGYMGGPDIEGPERTFTPEAEFFREYKDRYYTETESVADVAMLRTWPSMAYSINGTQAPTLLMEQVLIQHKVPFDIIFDQQMSTIGRYKAIVVSGQESLSRQWVDQLSEYARNGGTLVLGGNTADYNEYRQKRAANPLLSLAGISRAAVITVKTVGKGKLVYVPEIVPGIGVRPSQGGGGDETDLGSPGPSRRSGFPADRWVLPKNHQEIYQAVAGNLQGGLSITTQAPLNTVMEVVNRRSSNETIVHFVNFDDKRALAPFAVRLKRQLDGKIQSVSLFTPESDEPKKLLFTEQNGQLHFTVPAMKRYSMVVVAQAQ
jgi:glycosyl hydrolase family 42 (putative beta-galactosidase)